jgi:hypothetical protein
MLPRKLEAVHKRTVIKGITIPKVLRATVSRPISARNSLLLTADRIVDPDRRVDVNHVHNTSAVF